MKKFSIVFFILGYLIFPNFSYALTTLLTDDFTGTTINQSKWTMVGGTEGVDYIQNGNINVRNSGGTTVPGSATSLQSATSFAKGDDLTISANITASSGFTTIGYGNYSSGTYYFISVTSAQGYDAYIRKAGSAYSANTSCGSYTPGAKISMKITTNSFEVYKDDVFSCTVTVDGSAPVMTTHPIFLKGSSTGSFFDNVLVTNTTSAPVATVPDAITNLAASEWGDTTTNLTWTAPSNGGDPITDYTVEYRVSGEVSWTSFSDGVSASTGATVTGLTNGVAYEFRVFAVNGVGSSSASNTASVTVRAPTVPDAPTSVTATAITGDLGQVTVSFTAPVSNGGSSITSYTATSSPGGITGTSASSPITVSGLTNNQAYTFTVTATNSTGTSSPSAASNSATPLPYPTGASGSRAVWTRQNNSGARTWTDIASSSDGVKLVAIVSGGYIYTSTDSGITWTERTNSGPRNWSSVASSSDGVKLVATVNNGYIYTSTDSGANWTERATLLGSKTWSSVASSSDGTKLVATISGSDNTYTSTDSGVNWGSALIIPRSFVSSAITPDGTKKIVGTSSNRIYYDSSGSWIQYASAPTNASHVAISSDGLKIISLASSGSVYTSSDGGSNWSQQNSAPSANWTGVAMSYDGTRILASSYSYVYSSIDSGVSWRQETTTASWSSIASSSDGINLAATVSDGYIYTGVLDVVAPTITNISSDKANGTYATGEVVDIDVTFSEAVTSTGNVTITLETGDTDRTCTFTVSNSTTGTCNYTVVVGDLTSDLTVSSVSGTIADQVGNAMTDFVPATNLATNKAIVIDAIPPVISSVGSSITNTTSTISWTTDKVSSSYVEYGLTSSYGTTTTEVDTDTGVTSHQVLLSNLVKCTTYFYRVRSRDVALNPAVSSGSSFSTAGCVGGASIEDVAVESITNVSGGTATLSNATTTISLNIPPAVTDTDAVFQIKLLTKEDVVNASGVPDNALIQAETELFDLKAYTAIDTKVSTFNEPIEITMSYDTADIVGIDETTLKIYRYDEEAWYLTDDCSVDVDTNEITCKTNDFSVFSVFGTAPVVTNNQNSDPGGAVPIWLLQQISDRLRLENLKAQAKEVDTNSNTNPTFSCKKLPDNPKVLRLNTKNNSVKTLQEILNCKGYIISSSGAGSKGKETILFGKKTKEAVIRFQKANNLKGDGIVGPFTRNLLNK